MKTINVHTAFGIGHADGTSTKFAKGVHTVEDEIAEHPYTQVNSDEVVVTEKKGGKKAAGDQNDGEGDGAK